MINNDGKNIIRIYFGDRLIKKNIFRRDDTKVNMAFCAIVLWVWILDKQP